MYIFPASIPSAGGYQPAGALYLGTSDSLTRTNSSASDNTKKVTVSLWMKLLSHTTAASIIRLNSPDFDRLNMEESGSDDAHFTLTVDGGNNDSWGNRQWRHPKKVRDLTGWQSLVFTFDSTASSGDRFRIFDNGVERDPVAQTGSDFASDTTINWMANSKSPIILSSGEWLVADYIVLDGIAVTNADNFGELSDNGIWVPKNPSDISSFGTNGIWLAFDDPTHANGVGKDSSGNNNHFTPSSMGANNIAVDGPANSTTKEITLYPSPDASRKNSNITLSNHNLTVDSGSATGYTVPLNIPLSSGRWQITATVNAIDTSNGGPGLGFAYTANYSNATNAAADPSNFFGMRIRGGPEIQCNNNSTSWNPDNSTTLSTSHTLTLLIDIGAGKAWALQNGTVLQNSSQASVGNPAVGTQTNPTFTFTADSPITLFMMATSSATITLNPTTVNGSYSGYSAITKTVTGIGNVATLNPLIVNGTISEGNLKHTADASGYLNASVGTVSASSGKFYHEIDMVSSIDSTTSFGVVNVNDPAATTMVQTGSDYVGHASGGGWAYKPTPKKWTGGVQETYGVSVTDGDTLQVYTDLDNGKLYFGKNGTLMESADLDDGTGWAYDTLSGQIVPAFGIYENDVIRVRFSPEDWQYTPDLSDYKAWSTQNITEPTVIDPSKHFGIITHTGDTSSYPHDVTNSSINFTPDFGWSKPRAGTENHQIIDTVSGVDNYLVADENYAVGTGSNITFIENGYRVASGGNDRWNKNGVGIVTWMMKAGGAPTTDNVSNGGSPGQTPTNNSVFRDGSASTTAFASANIYPTRASIGTGFSILKYTGNGSSNQTLATGLTGAADFVLIKRHTAGGDWAAVGIVDSTIYGMELNNTTAEASVTDQVTAFGNGTITIDGGSANDSAVYSAYIFQKTSGLIGVGIYTSNDSTDGPHVIVDDGGSGFKPAFVMLKAIQGSQNWRIHDSARNGYNGSVEGLFPNTSGAEDTEDVMDMVSNGFKIRSSNDNVNGGTAGTDKYLYISFAETPFGLNNRAR